ncbi:FHA domain-containing protein [Acidobacteria bacterium AB60]|nr:FHA domain-containing protein [Acidobacteria bacterium AB60]
MAESTVPFRASIEVAFTDRPAQSVPISAVPYLIGRGRESGNNLPLDDMRVSRKCVAITAGPSGFMIEDRGQLNGIFVNGEATRAKALADGDRIRLGTDEGCQLVFRLQQEEVPEQTAETRFRSLLGSWGASSTDELKGLRMLLEATQLLHSQLPLESVLSTMLDHAIAITHADRGMLLEPDPSGVLQVKVARGRNGENLPPERMNPSRSVLGRALELQTAVVNEDLNLADLNVQTAQSVMLQLLRSAVVIPLYAAAHGTVEELMRAPRRLLGAVYLDSKRTATFSALDRQILDALGSQAASILDNARLVERERERRRLEQELSIAREIQQALVPQGLQDFPHLAVTGMQRPCHEVGGDYFDVFPISDGRTAILIADVAGKGLGAALLTTMLQGAISGMTLGVDPVRVFSHLNRFLCERASVGRYATMFFGLLGPDGMLEYVRASHPSPLLLRRGTISELYTGGSFPVGLIDMATYKADRIQLEPDDTLVLYSDGVTEAQNKNQDLFGDERLVEALGPYHNASLDELQAGILNAVEQFAGGASQSDDITILLVRYRRPVTGAAAQVDGKSLPAM